MIKTPDSIMEELYVVVQERARSLNRVPIRIICWIKDWTKF